MTASSESSKTRGKGHDFVRDLVRKEAESAFKGKPGPVVSFVQAVVASQNGKTPGYVGKRRAH